MRGEWRPIRASALLGGLLAAVLAACGPGGGAAPAASGGAAPAASGAAAPPPAGAAQPTQRTVAQIAALSGPDRQAILEEGARREGALMWYTALIVNQAVRPLVDGFDQKYPYVKVDYYRADSTDMIQRISNEYQARRYEVEHHRRHEHAADDQSRGLAGEVRLAAGGGLPERDPPTRRVTGTRATCTS